MPKVDRWPGAVDELSDVGKLVHLAYRQDSVDEEQRAVQLLRERREAYEQELTLQAARVGCPGRAARLGPGPILSSLKDASTRDARSIVGTLNYDAASQIAAIRAETPTANRFVYAKRLKDWNTKRASWKEPQIQQQAIGTARSQALSAFKMNNAITGYAVLRPKKAVCPICIGWVKRGKVPLAVATNNSPPYHPSCSPPGQLVLLEDGAEIPIEDVRVWHRVMTSKGSCLVKQVFQRPAKEPVYRLFAGGHDLRLTGDHPVLTPDGWIPVRDVKVGDLIAAVEGYECSPDDNDSKP